MEDILALYTEDLPKGHEIHCFDETPKPLRDTPRGTIAASSGKDQRIDYEYTRNGKRNVFVAVAPFSGTRTVKITKHRKKKDTAVFLWQYCMERHRNAKRIHLVLDNLNTHFENPLTEIWGEEKAAQFFARVQFHYTPYHASWLNMAEIEINCIKAQGLKNRIPDEKRLCKIAAAIVRTRNRERRTINWSFTKKKAQTKFPSLYATMDN
jgi:hypothetical protein